MRLINRKWILILLTSIAILFFIYYDIILYLLPKSNHCFDKLLHVPDISVTDRIENQNNLPIIGLENVKSLHILNEYIINRQNDSIKVLEISISTGLIAIGTANGFVAVWDEKQQIFAHEFDGPISSVSFRSDGQILAFYDVWGKIGLIDLNIAKFLGYWDVGHTSDANLLLFSKENHLIYASLSHILVCDINTRESQFLFDTSSLPTILTLNSSLDTIFYATQGDNDLSGTPKIGLWAMNQSKYLFKDDNRISLTNNMVFENDDNILIDDLNGNIIYINLFNNTENNLLRIQGKVVDFDINLQSNIICIIEEYNNEYFLRFVHDNNIIFSKYVGNVKIKGEFLKDGSLYITATADRLTFWSIR